MNKGLFSYIATVGFSLESANVVGYSECATTNGFKAMGASFAPVGLSMNLQDLRVTGYNHEDGFEGDLNIQFLDGLGRMDEMYFWIDIPADPEDPDSVAFYGWYDGNDNLAENKTIAPCDGLWVSSSSQLFGLQSSGQVITAPSSKNLGNEEFVMVANPLPIDVDIQDISVKGYDYDSGFEGDLNVQFLDTLGRMDEMYFWIDIPADPEDPDSVAFYGWYDGNDTLVENVFVGSGCAIWVYSNSNSYELEFPGVNL